MSLLRLLRVARLRLRSLLRKDAVDAELIRELRAHFDELVAEHVADGLSRAEARRAAHLALGNVASLEEACRDERRMNWAHDLRQDVVYGWRMLRRQPAFTAVAAVSLALGIGANTAVLGAFDALMFEGISVPHADRLVSIQAAPLDNPGQLSGLSLAEFAAYRARSHAFASMDVAIRWASELSGDGHDVPPERAQAQLVTPGWLSMLGIEPELGRAFDDEDSRGSQPPVIVLSHGFWQRRFGGNPHVVNTTLRVNGSTRTIVGVMPASFRYQDATIDFWIPLNVAPQPEAGARLFGVRARLAPGISIARAQAELDAIADGLAAERPAVQEGWGVHVRSLKDHLFGWTHEPLLTLEAAVALVLLIGCANVAALLVARGSTRQREVALRVALGAGRARIVRQLLTESLLLAGVGGVLGFGVAELGLHALVAMSTPPASPPLTAIGLNGRVLALLALLTIGTGIACGLAPAIFGSHLDPIVSLKDSGPLEGSPRRRLMGRGLLVSIQLALALVLLIGSGLLMSSFLRLARRDLNFVPDGLVRLDFSVPPARYAKQIGSYRSFPYFQIDPPPSEAISRVLDRLRTVPGAESVAGISAPPVDSFVLTTVDVQLADATPADAGPQSAAYFVVTPNLFSTIRTPIVRGRDFTIRDAANTPWFAIVNETAARRFWPSEDPIGKRLTLDIVPEERTREVIGVVRDIPTRHADDPQAVVYASFLQQPSRYRAPWAGLLGSMTFMLRAAGDPAAIVPAARLAVAEAEPDRPLAEVSTVVTHMNRATAKFRDFVLLVGVFAAAAVLLAAVGTYGVMVFTVSQRTREIGIRRALGAGAGQIVELVGRRALVLVGVGLAGGWAGALALTRLIASQLWGVTPTDPATYAAVSALLTGVAFVACVIPVRRALAVDPTIALRND